MRSEKKDQKIMIEEKGVNKVTLKGTVKNIQSGKTKGNIDFVNLTLSCAGMKYTENIPCLAYGDIARKICSSVSIGEVIIITARLRENTVGNVSSVSVLINRLDRPI